MPPPAALEQPAISGRIEIAIQPILERSRLIREIRALSLRFDEAQMIEAAHG
jgi:hypothetical protein